MTRVRAADVRSCRAVFEQMNELTAGGRVIRDFHADIAMLDHVIETEPFPYQALAAYSAWNLELPVSDEQRRTYFSAHCGGNQGDYRAGMRDSVANVVDCSTCFPASKRAVICVVAQPDAPHTNDGLDRRRARALSRHHSVESARRAGSDRTPTPRRDTRAALRNIHLAA